MKKRQKEAILIAFLQEKVKYKRLAEYIVALIQDDPSTPNESLHTIIYRLKDELRLIEKISKLNIARFDKGLPPITKKNYQEFIGDLLGVRIICLRLSDIGKIETYLKLLCEENIIHFIQGPDQKKSFILPLAPGQSIEDGTDHQYTGYSSTHYQIQLAENCDAPPELKKLQVELQLRTILEEAWSEIDHKYRYVRSRSGIKLPEHIHAGFYNLSAYLQVAAHQAEYLCRSAEADISIKSPKVKGKAAISLNAKVLPTAVELDDTPGRSTSAIEVHLEEIFGVKVTRRTLIYFGKRLGELNTEKTESMTLQQLFKKNRLLEFKAIFQEIMSTSPFENDKEHNIDAINALNFAISYQQEGKRVAQEGLRFVLRWRKNH
ncbi:MAG: GTP pyrophosphokinase [Proteobacteria bacterium]|nr:GTP pyrophosphokinase [Pseudomonadota bacterium]